MCGINIVGERNFLIAPKVGGSITHAECEYVSIYGAVKSKWRRTPDGVEYEVTVPTNTTARFVVGEYKKTLSPGIHKITI